MKLKSWAFGLALASGMAANGAQAETVLRLGGVAPSKSPWGVWLNQAAQEVEKVSGGQLKIQLMLDSQIGDELTMARQVSKGRLDMASLSSDPMAVSLPTMDLLTGAYVYDSDAQATCVQFNHLSKLFNPLLEKIGMRTLAWLEVGHTVIFSKEPLRMPEDLKGVKIRVAQGVVKNDYMHKLGAAPSPLGTADTIPALQTGTVTAVTYPVVFGVAVGVPKLAPHVLLTEHMRPPAALVISERTWKKLSKQEQEWLSVIGPMAPKFSQVIMGAEKAMLAKAAEAGVDVHALTPEEAKAWRASAQGTLEASAQKLGPDAVAMIAKINAAKQACGN